MENCITLSSSVAFFCREYCALIASARVSTSSFDAGHHVPSRILMLIDLNVSCLAKDRLHWMAFRSMEYRLETNRTQNCALLSNVVVPRDRVFIKAGTKQIIMATQGILRNPSLALVSGLGEEGVRARRLVSIQKPLLSILSTGSFWTRTRPGRSGSAGSYPFKTGPKTPLVSPFGSHF